VNTSSSNKNGLSIQLNGVPANELTSYPVLMILIAKGHKKTLRSYLDLMVSLSQEEGAKSIK